MINRQDGRVLHPKWAKDELRESRRVFVLFKVEAEQVHRCVDAVDYDQGWFVDLDLTLNNFNDAPGDSFVRVCVSEMAQAFGCNPHRLEASFDSASAIFEVQIKDAVLLC